MAIPTTMLNLPAATGLSGAESLWIVQDGSDKSTSIRSIGIANGGGNVIGPISVTNNTIAVFDGTTGKLLKNATGLISVFTGLNDISAIAGALGPASFWNPTWAFPSPSGTGTGVVHRFNRVMVGDAAHASSDYPVSTPDWVTTLFGLTGGSQLMVTSTVGLLGISGAVRTSDFRAWAGSASGGAHGITGFAYNNDTVGNPIAAGLVGIGVHAVGCTGVTLHQFDTNNLGSVVDATPSGGVAGGQTFALGLTPGAYSALGTLHNVSAAIYLDGTTAKFRKGIICFAAALDISVGSGGGGVAIELSRGQDIRWLNGAGTVDAALYATVNGLTLRGTPTSAITVAAIPGTDYSGVFLWTAPSGANYALAAQVGGADSGLYINRPVGGRIHIKEGGLAGNSTTGDQISIYSATDVSTIALTGGVPARPTFLLQSTTDALGGNQVSMVLGLVNNQAGNNLPFFSGAEANVGSVNTWAGNFLTTIGAANTTLGGGGAWIVEMDADNSVADFGNTAGIGGLALPVFWGLNLTGAGSKRNTSAIYIDFVTSPRWNRGVTFGPISTFQADIESYSTAIASYVDRGTHSTYSIDLQPATNTVGYLRAANNSWLVQRNAANGADLNVMKIDGSNVLSLYNGICTISTPAAGQTALSVFDFDNSTLERVTVGAADSGGAGFKVLRIPN